MKSRTLGTVVLSLALGLGSFDCNRNSSRTDQPVHSAADSVKSITGTIEAIDEDSFVFVVETPGGGGGAANFEYEIFRVKDENGEMHKLIMPSPSSYAVGDNFSGKYRLLNEKSISTQDLIGKYFLHSMRAVQKGGIDAEGIIIK
jgi:hypothetical protein